MDGAVFDPAPKIPVVTVTLPVLIVALVKVKFPMLVTVFPSPTVVFPMVTGVLKLASRFDNGIEVVAVPNVYGTGIFRTSLSIHVQVQMY
jgi:hypothetical protein